jgi:hypothetical protein
LSGPGRRKRPAGVSIFCGGVEARLSSGLIFRAAESLDVLLLGDELALALIGEQFALLLLRLLRV